VTHVIGPMSVIAMLRNLTVQVSESISAHCAVKRVRPPQYPKSLAAIRGCSTDSGTARTMFVTRLNSHTPP
jgi:hypothetical protein